MFRKEKIYSYPDFEAERKERRMQTQEINIKNLQERIKQLEKIEEKRLLKELQEKYNIKIEIKSVEDDYFNKDFLYLNNNQTIKINKDYEMIEYLISEELEKEIESYLYKNNIKSKKEHIGGK